MNSRLQKVLSGILGLGTTSLTASNSDDGLMEPVNEANNYRVGISLSAH